MNVSGVASSVSARWMPVHLFIELRVPPRFAIWFVTSITIFAGCPGVTRSVMSYLYVPQ